MGVRALVAGGGTGGHLFPALAVAEALRAGGAEILFVGTRAGVEARLVPQRGFDIEYISAAGFRRRRIAANLTLPIKVLAAFVESDRIVRRFRPQAALGTGGYVCGPIVLAAALRRVPVVLQEQNSYPGFTTRLLARFAKTVFLNFSEAATFLPAKTNWQHVGNPVRPGFANLDRLKAIRQWELNSELPTLLVFGGSQGAMSLNRAVAQVLPELGSFCNLIWSRGKLDTSDPSGWAGPGKLMVRPFIEDMPSAYAAADLAVCRSGAMTLSELQAAALPAILIPYPHAAGNHQKHNAISYSTSGGAVVIEDREFGGSRLLKEVKETFADRGRLPEMRKALLGQPRQNAAQIIAQEVLRVAGTAAK